MTSPITGLLTRFRKKGTMTTESPTPGSHLEVARALTDDLAAEAAADAAVRAELEDRERRRQVARELAERELAEAQAAEEGCLLEQHELPQAAAELAALGATVRGAFDELTAALPRLLAAQVTIDTLVKRAEALKAHGVSVRVPRVPRLGGIAKEVLALIDHAIKAQAGVDR